MIKKIVIVALVLLNIGCDQISKNVVRRNIDARETIELVGKNFIITKVENSGAMLGFGSELSPILKIIFLQALPVLILMIGNLIDRIAYGEVTDFFHIDLGGYFKTGIFNMADVSVTMGVLVILFLSFRYRKLEM